MEEGVVGLFGDPNFYRFHHFTGGDNDTAEDGGTVRHHRCGGEDEVGSGLGGERQRE